MTRIPIASIVLSLLLAAVCRGDILHLKNGNKIEGQITSEGDADVRIRTTVGSVTIKRDDIERIEKKVSPLQQYENTAGTIDDDDSVGHYTLGMWCKENGLKKQAREQFLKTLAANPEHVDAHKELGHVLHAGKWMTEEESMKAKGFVLHQGRWITSNEAEGVAQKTRQDDWRARLKSAADTLQAGNLAAGRKLFDSITASTPEPAAVAAALVSLAEHPSAEARKEIVKALGRLRTPEAFDGLIEVLLNEKSLEIAQAAVTEARKINGKRAVRQLTTALNDIRFRISTAANDQKPALVRAVERGCLALGLFGDDMAVPELVNCLVIEVNYAHDVSSPTKTEGPLTSTTTPFGTVGGVPIETTTTSSVSITTKSSDTEIVRFFYNDEASSALRSITGQRFDFERKKWLQWWAARKPVLPPEEDEFDM
ncbi:MAG TPA: HEAT repeat domain-containing protein [Planctomycetota bacterium]|nr:HEAT repeat domain-containing protein [Planctomycetota bacterium]